MDDPNETKSTGRPSAAEFECIGRAFAEQFPRALSDLFGVDVRGAWPPGSAKKFAHFFARAGRAAEAFQKEQPRSLEEAVSKTGDFLTALAPPQLKIPRGVRAFAWLLRRLEKQFKGISADPKGRKYLRALDHIIARYAEGTRHGKADAFLTAAAQQDGALAFQGLSRRIGEREMAFCIREIRSRRPTLAHVPRLLSLYGTAAGIYEKLICRLVGLLEINEGKEPSYGAIRKRRLADNLAVLAKEPSTAVFAAGFSRPLRNAVAHEEYEILPSRRRIRFRAGGKEFLMTPGEVSKQTEETMAAVMALLLLDSRRAYRRLAAISRLAPGRIR